MLANGQSVRSYLELPGLAIATASGELLTTKYATNSQWLVDKCHTTQSILYFMQDLQLARRHLDTDR